MRNRDAGGALGALMATFATMEPPPTPGMPVPPKVRCVLIEAVSETSQWRPLRAPAPIVRSRLGWLAGRSCLGGTSPS